MYRSKDSTNSKKVFISDKACRKSTKYNFFFNTRHQSQETDSLETRAVLIEISIYVEIYRAAQKTGDHFKKTWLSLKGMKENKLFAGDFRTNLDETNADMVQFIKRWNWKWIA